VAGYALQALRQSQVREVVLLGRRGPGQAAFDLSELSDIAELDGVSVHIDPVHIEQALAQAEQLDRVSRKKLEYMAELSQKPALEMRRRVRLEFLTSPVELIGRGGRVQAVKVERNQLVLSDGNWRAEGTGNHFMIDAGLVFRSIGYHGIAMPGVPFDRRGGIIPNREGRVSDTSGNPVAGLYVVGWIKRGPTGVIGTNKPDAQQTVRHMLEDAAKLPLEPESHKTRGAVDALLKSRDVEVADLIAWRLLDELERSRGAKLGKIRDKFSSVREMLAAIEKHRQRQV
jgi:ferredoxin--NADP+ reductase